MSIKEFSMRTLIACWPDLENDVVEWVQEHRQIYYVVTRNMIRYYTLNWKQRVNAEEREGFKAIVCGCNRFMKRKKSGNTAENNKKNPQKLPSVLTLHTSFYKFVNGVNIFII